MHPQLFFFLKLALFDGIQDGGSGCLHPVHGDGGGSVIVLVKVLILVVVVCLLS